MILTESYKLRLLKLANLSESKKKQKEPKEKEFKDGVHLPDLYMEKKDLIKYLDKFYGLKVGKQKK